MSAVRLSLRRWHEFEIGKCSPLAIFVFLLEQPLPSCGFRRPAKGGVERPVGILEDETNLVSVAVGSPGTELEFAL